MSSQLVNFHKSMIQISNNIKGAKKRRLGEALNIPISNEISKHLGCLLVQVKIKRKGFSEVILKSHRKPF